MSRYVVTYSDCFCGSKRSFSPFPTQKATVVTYNLKLVKNKRINRKDRIFNEKDHVPLNRASKSCEEREHSSHCDRTSCSLLNVLVSSVELFLVQFAASGLVCGYLLGWRDRRNNRVL